VAHAIFEIIAAAESEVARSEFLAAAAGHLKLPVGALQRDFETFRRRSIRNTPTATDTQLSVHSAKLDITVAVTPEHSLLMLVLHFEALGKSLSQLFPHAWIDTNHTAGVLLRRFLGEIEHDNWPGRDHLDGLLETPEERALVASLLFEQPKYDDPATVANMALKSLTVRAFKPELDKIELAMASQSLVGENDYAVLKKRQSELKARINAPPQLPPIYQ
jgi:DNA primase